MISEKPIQIIVNGRATLTVMTQSETPLDLVYGLLMTERVIDTIDNIDSVITEEPQISIVTKHPYSILLSRKTVLAGCGGASSFLDSGKLGKIETEIKISDTQIQNSIDAVAKTAWFSGGLFSADGKLLASAEDLTAQNVADTLIGYGLREHTDLTATYAVLNGNCTAETVRKFIIAKIPLLILHGKQTRAAAEIADNSGLTIISR